MNLPLFLASFVLVQIEPDCGYCVARSPKIDKNPVSGISPALEKGSELDSALKGFQLTCIVGFAWKYMYFPDQPPFDQALTKKLDDGDADRVKHYRERYLDCTACKNYIKFLQYYCSNLNEKNGVFTVKRGNKK